MEEFVVEGRPRYSLQDHGRSGHGQHKRKEGRATVRFIERLASHPCVEVFLLGPYREQDVVPKGVVLA